MGKSTLNFSITLLLIFVALERGGVRGMLELQLLKHLEAQIEFDIPIQQLFDLVIGTSTGNNLIATSFRL